VFNDNEKYIIAHYPLEAFENWLDLLKLKRKKTQLTFNYVSDPSKNIKKAFLSLEENF
jgi:ADP-heptose:LPS heptosyltransferase